MVAVKKFKLRQRLQLTWIRLGDANSKFFHLRANARWQHNHIHCLLHEGAPRFTHEAKAQAPEDFFGKHLGFTDPRQHTINWYTIHPDRYDLSDLDRDITEEEIHAAVMQTPSDKAPSLNGYIGGFFKMHWNIIWIDMIAMLREIFELRADY
jgi:hypothetical protein